MDFCLGWGRFWAAHMSIFAAYLQRWCLEPYFGITVRFPLIWEEESICYIASFGGLRQLCGLSTCIRLSQG